MAALALNAPQPNNDIGHNEAIERSESDGGRNEGLPPGTIQACHQPGRRKAVPRRSFDRYCSGVTLASQVLMAVTALRTTASAKEQK